MTDMTQDATTFEWTPELPLLQADTWGSAQSTSQTEQSDQWRMYDSRWQHKQLASQQKQPSVQLFPVTHLHRVAEQVYWRKVTGKE